MTERLHAWGPHFLGPDEVSFRVWADGQDKLSLVLAGAVLEMGRDGDGWFERTMRGASAGMPYCYRLADGRDLPDPAARAQRGDVHGPSLLVDSGAHGWRTTWQGRPWHEAVIYELHVGTFTPEGTFRAAIGRLDHLARLGITAIEIMPVAQFSGTRGWGYDGVLLYAPHNAYGSPDDFRALVDAAHQRGLMVLLDVVYNHFGPDGNYLGALAPGFFEDGRQTPWGAGIAYGKAPVRAFFIDNALHWIGAFELDGLRLDAIDQIVDASPTHILVELARKVRSAFPERHVHLTTEDNRNVTFLHEREDGAAGLYSAEWNDDFHNAAHVVATDEREGYYEDFAEHPVELLARSLAEGFAYQGEASRHAGGAARGQPSAHLSPTAFINFLQNHDQVGNRALGERLCLLAEPERLRALTTIMLLAPSIPLLFMGEEYGARTPFFFFTDFHGELGDAVREGRRREFSQFSAFSAAPETIPDPNAPTTCAQSRLDWNEADAPAGRTALSFHRELLDLRKRAIVPLLADTGARAGTRLATEGPVVAIDWRFAAGLLSLRANLGPSERRVPTASGGLLRSEPADAAALLAERGVLGPWQVIWTLTPRASAP